MSVKIIQERLNLYQCASVQEEAQALREITQEVALAALARTDFFKYAAFHGGTCLRILYGLNRFSEDLDFTLKQPDNGFQVESYISNLAVEFKAFGFELEVIDRSEAELPVKKVFLKDNSIGKVLKLKHLKSDRSEKKIKIKLEIDTNPPDHAGYESKMVDFPFIFSLTALDRSGLFAGKIHALLSRIYVKGRDWYDFLWYLRNKDFINLKYLSSALDQQGPWQGQKLTVDQNWVVEALTEKIKNLDWDNAIKDVLKFIKPLEVKSVELWNKELFLAQLEKYLKEKKDHN